MLGEAGKLPEIYSDLEINYFLLRRLLGVKTEGDKKAGKVPPCACRCLGSASARLCPCVCARALACVRVCA